VNNLYVQFTEFICVLCRKSFKNAPLITYFPGCFIE